MEGKIEILLKFSIECKINEQLSLSRFELTMQIYLRLFVKQNRISDLGGTKNWLIILKFKNCYPISGINYR